MAGGLERVAARGARGCFKRQEGNLCSKIRWHRRKKRGQTLHSGNGDDPVIAAKGASAGTGHQQA